MAAGGLVGDTFPSDTEKFACSITNSSAIGTGLTTAEMFQQANYAGWTFPYPWTIDEGNDYPRLHWE